MSKIKSARGVEVDFAKFMAQNEETVAVGNGAMNARGDILGRGGKIVKTRDQVAADAYNTHNPRAVKKVSLKDIAAEAVSPAEAVRIARENAAKAREEAEAQAQAAEERKMRKIVDAD